jgi:hypothetical protein
MTVRMGTLHETDPSVGRAGADTSRRAGNVARAPERTGNATATRLERRRPPRFDRDRAGGKTPSPPSDVGGPVRARAARRTGSRATGVARRSARHGTRSSPAWSRSLRAEAERDPRRASSLDVRAPEGHSPTAIRATCPEGVRGRESRTLHAEASPAAVDSKAWTRARGSEGVPAATRRERFRSKSASLLAPATRLRAHGPPVTPRPRADGVRSLHPKREGPGGNRRGLR